MVKLVKNSRLLFVGFNRMSLRCYTGLRANVWLFHSPKCELPSASLELLSDSYNSTKLTAHVNSYNSTKHNSINQTQLTKNTIQRNKPTQATCWSVPWCPHESRSDPNCSSTAVCVMCVWRVCPKMAHEGWRMAQNGLLSTRA